MSGSDTTYISNVIKKRIEKAGARFNANDNIADFIEEGELDLLQQEVEEKMTEVLKSLVINIETDHNTQETARRVAKMYVRFDLAFCLDFVIKMKCCFKAHHFSRLAIEAQALLKITLSKESFLNKAIKSTARSYSYN